MRILEAAKEGHDPNCSEENPHFIDEVNSMMDNGRMILGGASFFDIDSFAQSEQIYGGELSYIGQPTPDRSCAFVFHVS